MLGEQTASLAAAAGARRSQEEAKEARGQAAQSTTRPAEAEKTAVAPAPGSREPGRDGHPGTLAEWSPPPGGWIYIASRMPPPFNTFRFLTIFKTGF